MLFYILNLVLNFAKLADRELWEARPRHDQIRGLSTRRSLVWPQTILGVAMACRSRHASSVEEAQQPVCMHLSRSQMR